MRNSFKISVIVPSYNASNFIIQCLESVINQTYKPNEIIVVNDNSTDNTYEQVQNYIKSNNSNIKIKLFSNKKNMGPSYSRNIGLKNINQSTDFISFLDADDFWDNNKLAEQIKFFKNNKDILFCYCFYDVYINDLKKFEIRCNFDSRYVMNQHLFYENCISGSSSSVMISIKLFHKVGFFNETFRCAEDWDYWLRCFLYTRLGSINKVLTHIRIHSNNAQRNRPFMYEESIKFWNNRFKREHASFRLFYYFIKAVIFTNYYPRRLIFKKELTVSFFFPNSKILFYFLYIIIIPTKFFIILFLRCSRKLIRIFSNNGNS